MIVEVDESNILSAAEIHSEAWKDSHKNICSPSFIELHTVERQKAYLHREIRTGKRVYMLVEKKPVGIVSVYGDLVENLYVLPKEQRKGYGAKLLLFAVEQCPEKLRLWILDGNRNAYSLYFKYGFRETGNRRMLSERFCEIEMAREVCE